ncbi:MAG TPA: GGDEF domain-containing protein, partial [Thermoguttaceae bacterium]|nr:GGDEF domain-containing protein [Thermoguttaceae bacterium]
MRLGIWWGRRKAVLSHPAVWPTAEARQLAQLAQALTGLVHSVAQDVDQHQTRIKQANEGLRSLTAEDSLPPEHQPSAWAAVVLRTVAEIVQVNERLQHRLQQAEDKLQEQSQQIQNHMAEARTDPLTGLPNRRAFDDELVRRLAEWKRKGALFCLLLVDIDHFKELNDQYGHPAGDQVLRQLAEVLLTVLREMDLAARIGGEEFAVLLPST